MENPANECGTSGPAGPTVRVTTRGLATARAAGPPSTRTAASAAQAKIPAAILTPMRIASLVPSATETLFALGSLDPLTLDHVRTDLVRVAEAAGDPDAGRRAQAEAHRRLAAVASRQAGTERPRAVAIEWLDPPFIAGHWVPEMFAIAGGIDALG